jgi:hypothetical protein
MGRLVHEISQEEKMAKVLLRGVLCLLCAVTAAGATVSFASDQQTVGSFIQRLATHNRLEATTPEAADAALRNAGLRIPDNLDHSAALTQAHVVAITRAMGIKVSTTRPSSLFGERQVDQLFFYFGSELANRDGAAGGQGTRAETPPDGEQDGPPFDPFAKGKGKGKQPHSPTDP